MTDLGVGVHLHGGVRSQHAQALVQIPRTAKTMPLSKIYLDMVMQF